MSFTIFQIYRREPGLSDKQSEICSWRKAGLSYRQIRQECSRREWTVRSDEGLTKCFTRTALGQYWVPEHDGIVTFSSSGKVFTPGIILPKLQNLPTELSGFAENAHFYISENSWMTKDVFLSYCINLAHEISLWRPTLPPAIRNNRILLLVDGHPSRRCSAGIEYLRMNAVDLFTFPSHFTHLLQPFGVLCPSALKARLRTSVAGWNHRTNTGWMPQLLLSLVRSDRSW